MKKYLSVFIIRFNTGIQYRVAALAGMATQFFWGFMLIMIFQAYYANASVSSDFTISQLVTYIWLQQAFLGFVMLYFRDKDIEEMILKGNIAYELCRPFDIYGIWYFKSLAQRVSAVFLRFFPVLFFASLLPSEYRLMPPVSLPAFFLFLVNLFLGLLVTVTITVLVYISMFATFSSRGSFAFAGVISEFFSGSLIPIPLMPIPLQKIAYILPFRLGSDLPFRIYSGSIPVREGAMGIFVQIFWLFVLFLAGRRLLGRSVKNVVVQGG